MRRMALLMILAVMVIPWCEAVAARKALVIGIGTYEHLQDLSTTEADARVFGETLQQFGFQVQQPQGSDIQSLKGTVDAFLRSLRSEDEALLYFSGHGMQRSGDNFLFGSDADVNESTSIFTMNTQGVNVTQLVEAMEERAGLALLFLDACRTIQLPGNKGQTKGGFTFTNVEVQQSASFIGFAAGENQPAFTGDDGELLSPYTKALVVALSDASLASEPLPNLHSQVRRLVRQATGNSQLPDYRNHLGNREFRFARLPDLPSQVARKELQPKVEEKERDAGTEMLQGETPILQGQESADSVSVELEALNKMMVSLGTVPSRRAPSLLSQLASDVSEGQEIQALARTKQGDWYQIRVGNEVAYLPSTYLVESRPVDKTMVLLKDTQIRRSPDVSAGLVGAVREGQQLKVNRQAEKWYRGQVGNVIGYVESNVLVEIKNVGKENEMVMGESVALRRAPTSGASQEGYVEQGERVEVLGRTGDWFSIKSRGKHGSAGSEKLGYVGVGSLLELEVMNKTLVVTQRTTLRRAPASTSEAVRDLEAEEKLKVSGLVWDWYLVNDGERSYYVHSSYLRDLQCSMVSKLVRKRERVGGSVRAEISISSCYDGTNYIYEDDARPSLQESCNVVAAWGMGDPLGDWRELGVRGNIRNIRYRSSEWKSYLEYCRIKFIADCVYEMRVEEEICK